MTVIRKVVFMFSNDRFGFMFSNDRFGLKKKVAQNWHTMTISIVIILM